ncbi:MAG: chorismate synthase [Methanospirillaceae archaeon]|nr:chorismate synthase [Methanospirillaceae archaeon]
MNTFGRHFRCTTFGESHGRAIGVIIDGCPSRIGLSESDIQPFLDRRRPGTSDLVTPRQESDTVEILSGVYEGCTTGTPIALLIRNTGQHSSDYEYLRHTFRPGHADRAYFQKYGWRDHRGGGRSSGRETAARVAAGAVAALILSRKGITIQGKITEIHGERDPDLFLDIIRKAQEKGDSVGGIVEVIVCGCPAGLGDPVFGKLDALIAMAFMSIGAVKGIEIGDGFAATRLFGSEHNDGMRDDSYLSNHAGGILGGISTGQDIIARIAVKPTPSIAASQQTITDAGEEVSLSVTGRHDPCIALRIVPVAEAMLALVIIDAMLANQIYQDF